MTSKIPLVWLLFLSAVSANAQSNSGICRVTAYWWDKQNKVGSGTMILGRFNPVVADETTIKTFKLMDSSLIVTAGIMFERDYGKSTPAPFEVRMAITVSTNAAKDIFGSVESSEASTLFKKHWNLAAGKNIEVDGRIHTFTLRCSDNFKSAK